MLAGHNGGPALEDEPPPEGVREERPAPRPLGGQRVGQEGAERRVGVEHPRHDRQREARDQAHHGPPHVRCDQPDRRRPRAGQPV
jgi:hypothetical protein